jgi:hypothetical protein
MNAIPDPASMALRTVDWMEVFREVNEWRGACLHHFTVVEMAVTETLMALDRLAPAGVKVRLQPLGGQRLDDLLAATTPDGHFSKIGAQSHHLIASYRENHGKFRNQLCHGQFKVVVEPKGNWQVIVREIAFQSGAALHSLTVIEQNEAQARLKQLDKDGKMIRSTLGQLRKAAETPA